ncbi:MAG: hypothetical protein AAB817_00610 [Patescibacteria group bacterium]
MEVPVGRVIRIDRATRPSGKRTFLFHGLPGINGYATLRVTPAAVVELPTSTIPTASGRLRIPRRVERLCGGSWDHYPSVIHVGQGPDTPFTAAFVVKDDGTLAQICSQVGAPDMTLFAAAEAAGVKTATVYPDAVSC